jgi:hypothetical protein
MVSRVWTHPRGQAETARTMHASGNGVRAARQNQRHTAPFPPRDLGRPARRRGAKLAVFYFGRRISNVK